MKQMPEKDFYPHLKTLLNEIISDLQIGPEQTIADLHELQKIILNMDNSFLFKFKHKLNLNERR